MKLVKSLVLTLALGTLLFGALTVARPTQAQAKRCCWFMMCTNEPPIVCWEVCYPCPL